MKSNVHVAGVGVISAIGNSISEHMKSFQQHKSGISSITLFDTIHKPSIPVGEVKLSNIELQQLLGLQRNTTRTAMLGLYAAKEAVQNSGIALEKWRTGLVSATTVGGMDKTENFFIDFLQNAGEGNLHDVVDHACARSTEYIADTLGINNFVSTINTACSSSVNAVIYGARLIQNGFLDVVIAGGTDALTRFTLNGFNSLMILDNQPCRPFDAERKGLNLGEGAGYVILVSESLLHREGINSLCFISGYGNTNDAYHQTASSPEGRGSYAAMSRALAMAHLNTEQIDYINLHGTGTVNNDQSEATAIHRLFGERHPKVSSTKSFTGHTLGACGGIEAVFSVLAIQHSCVFPNLRFQQAMPEVNIQPQTNYRSGQEIKHVMSNSFGFGGNCSSIIFSKQSA